MSLGGQSYTSAAACDAAFPALKAAIDNLVAADIPVVVASGNEYATNAIAAPACISSALSVGAVDAGDVVADFSNSAGFLDSLAPGYGVVAPVPGGYDIKSGTSMAAPHVAGAVSVLRSATPAAAAGEILSAVTATGIPVTDWRNGVVTPRVQVDAALQLLTNGSLDRIVLGLESFLSGLDRPIWITHAGDASGRLFVALEGGEVLIHDGTSLLATPFLDLSATIGPSGRLVALAFDPAHATNGRLYVTYVDGAGNLILERYGVSGNPDQVAPGTGAVLLTIPMVAGAHAGGHMSFGLEGYLYLAVGDGALDGAPAPTAGDLGVLPGKVLRIDVSGSGGYAVPPDNPYVGVAGVREEIWASGLRNPFRIAFDSATGELFVTDRGEDAFEEVNVQPPNGGGEDYGWDVMQGFDCYGAPSCNSSGLTQPITGYDHAAGCAITGGEVYRGAQVPELIGTYLYGDRCSGEVVALRRDGNGGWDERAILGSGLLLESFGRDESGNVYLLDTGAGRVVRLVPSDLGVTTARLPQGNVGTSYTLNLAASGGTPPYSWSIVAGSLPQGLTLDPASGTLAGVPNVSVTQTLTVRVEDAARARHERLFSITVTPPPLLVDPPSLPEGRLGQPFTGSLSASGGAPPYQWSVSSGAPPPGISLASDGSLSGTPNDEGRFQFVARVADSAGEVATGTVTLSIFGPEVPLTLGVTDNNAYGHQFGSDGHTLGLDLVFNSTVRPLALHLTGFDIDAADEISVHLNGTHIGDLSAGPNEAFNSGDSITLPQGSLIDGANRLRLLQKTPGFKWGVTGILVSTELTRVAVSTTSIPDMTEGAAVSEALQASGGVGPYVWSLSAGALPPGLSLSTAGVISGTPTTQGAYAFTVQVTDGQGMIATSALSLRVVGLSGEIEVQLTPGVTDPGAYGYNYGSNQNQDTLVTVWQSGGNDVALYVTGFDIDWADEISVELNGALIGYLSPGPNNGLNAGDVFHIAASSQLAGRNQVVFRQRVSGWTWGVTALRLEEQLVPLVVSPETLADATAGSPYSAQLQADGVGPYGWTLFAGALPAGLSLSPTGLISGTTSAQGQYRFSVDVTDSRGATGSAQISMRVVGLSGQIEVQLTPGVTDPGAYGYQYGSDEHQDDLVVTWQDTGSDVVLQVTGYDIDWNDEISVELNGTTIGYLSPGPNNALNAGDVFPIAASNQISGRNELIFRQRVSGWIWGVTGLRLEEQALPLQVSTTTLADATDGVSYSEQLDAIGGMGTHTWSLASGVLPAGISLSSSGLLSGTTTAQGIYDLTLEVADSQGTTASAALSLRVVGLSGQIEVQLTPGVIDNNAYGYNYGSGEHQLALVAVWQGTGGDVALHVTGYDIDWGDEISVELNGAPIGYLSAGPDNALNAGDVFQITAGQQLSGRNELVFRQRVSGWTWGITGLLISTATTPLTISTSSLPDGIEGAAVNEQLQATGGLQPYAWSLTSGTLPPGLNLATDGVLSGTPTAQGTFSFTVEVRDSQGLVDSAALSMRVVGVNGTIEVALTPGITDPGAYGYNYGSNAHETMLMVTWQGTGSDVSLHVTGYDIDWPDEIAVELNGTLIGYLSVGPNNGLNSGDVFLIQASSQLAGRNEVVFRQKVFGWTWGVTGLRIDDKPIVTSPPLGDATVNNPYFVQLDASGGVGPYAWSLSAGALPAGMGLASDGVLSGTPTVQGDYAFTVEATDTRGLSGSKSFNLRVVGLSGSIEVELIPGTPDPGKYGHNYGSSANQTTLVVIWQSTGSDVSLHVTGYDIDYADEISVELNGATIGYLSAGPNNNLNAGDVFSIPASSQIPGRNEIVFRQRVAGWTWGVTGLLLTP
ncbi:MAG TPA: putative Ig domain-containing protein [Gammaproteobacteria bacterium]|nr:putative Ig domain-containing protein [Gammaproteobacteria bacterium]